MGRGTVLVIAAVFALVDFAYAQYKPIPPKPMPPNCQPSEQDKEREGEDLRQFSEEGYELQKQIKMFSKNKKESDIDDEDFQELHENIDKWLKTFRQRKEGLSRLATKRPFFKDAVQNLFGLGNLLDVKDSEIHKEIYKRQKEKQKLQREEKPIKEEEPEDSLTEEEEMEIIAHKLLEGHHCEKCCDDPNCQEHHGAKSLSSAELEKWSKIAKLCLNEEPAKAVLKVRQNERTFGSEYSNVVRQILDKVNKLTNFDNEKIKGLVKNESFVDFFNAKIGELSNLTRGRDLNK